VEDTSGASTEGVAGRPFSELISRWLEEGDRLSEAMSTSRGAAVSRAETPLGQALLRLRVGVERHRLSFLVCVGLLSFALFLATHHPHGEPVPVVSASASSLAPIRTSRAPSPPPAGVQELHELAVAAPKAPPAAREAVVAAPKTPPAVRTATIAAPKAPRAVRRLAVAVPKAPRPARAVAVAGPQVPSAARSVAIAGPQAPPAARPLPVAGPQAPPAVRPVAIAAPQAPPAVRPVVPASPKAPHVARRVAVAGP